MPNHLSGARDARAQSVRERSGGPERLLQLHSQGIPLGTQEIAVVLGCSREYVRLLYNSGMRKLRAALLDREAL